MATPIPTDNSILITKKRAELSLLSGRACISVSPTPLQVDQPGYRMRSTGSFSLLYLSGRLASAKGG
jgi:hypothetical protein